MRALLVIGAAVAAYFVWARSAKASSSPAAGFGQPGFQAPATPTSPAVVTGCSFARAGSILVDANTGREISEKEAQLRSKREGCPIPPPSIFVQMPPGVA